MLAHLTLICLYLPQCYCCSAMLLHASVLSSKRAGSQVVSMVRASETVDESTGGDAPGLGLAK